MRRTFLLTAVALVAVASANAGFCQTAPDYSTVTQARLDKPEPQNWLMTRGTYNGWGYSPLDQINAKNVKTLVPVWSLSTGVVDAHQAPPIVNNGIMFVSTPQDRVLAVDARTGDTIWRYERQLPADMQQLHPTNRGVALYGDKVYIATMDACVVALTATTGKVAWEHCVAKWRDGYYMTLAPLAAKGKVVVGVSGGELGIRGFIDALDSETGQEAWKFYTVAGPGQTGADTWKGDSWKTGGAPVWMQGNYDPATNTVYFGTGNGGPWMPDTRSGDNLFSTSAVALDGDTGKLKGYHQYHWNDAWDWDEVSPPLLIDVDRGGRTVHELVHAGRDGYLWQLERHPSGEIDFISGQPFVHQDVFKSVDPKTGRPAYNEDKVPGTKKQALFCPSLWGGKDWPMEAYSPKTKLYYVPANDNLCATISGEPLGPREAGSLYVGVPIDDIFSSMRPRPGVDASKPMKIGQLQAWNLATGKKVWSHDFIDSATWGPVLATGGNLVFTGGTNDRMFRAFDAANGDVKWQTRLNAGVLGAPSTFMVDGVQYIAVQSGYGVDAERQNNGLKKMLAPRLDHQVVPNDGTIWVFALLNQPNGKGAQ